MENNCSALPINQCFVSNPGDINSIAPCTSTNIPPHMNTKLDPKIGGSYCYQNTPYSHAFDYQHSSAFTSMSLNNFPMYYPSYNGYDSGPTVANFDNSSFLSSTESGKDTSHNQNTPHYFHYEDEFKDKTQSYHQNLAYADMGNLANQFAQPMCSKQRSPESIALSPSQSTFLHGWNC